MTSTLRVIAEKASSHRPMLSFVPVFHALLFDRAPRSSSASEALILGNVAVVLALTAHACADDIELFVVVLAVIDKLVKATTIDCGDARGEGSLCLPMRNGSVAQPLGLPTAIERLVCALCDLLLSFHEDEVNNSFFPGYEIKPVRNSSAPVPSSPTLSTSSRDRKRGGRLPDVRLNAPTSLLVRSKSNGVFSKGYSPANPNIVKQILEIFTKACTLPVARVRGERQRLRSGRSIGGASPGISILYVSDFFFQAAKTPSGRFFFLNPLVIQFWKALLPRMDSHSLSKLCDGLVMCTLSKDHIIKFLASGALRLLVAATCIIVRSADVEETRTSTKSLAVVDQAFQQLLVAAAVLTERAPFLQSTVCDVGADS